MKKVFVLVGAVLAAMLVFSFVFIACNKEFNNNTDKLLYEKTELGGCNVRAALRSGNTETDKVIITVTKESVHVFVGHNYICKAIPFETRCEMTDGVLCMYIIDSCNEGCYMRCDCFYTFDFIFKRESQTTLNQKYKIFLIDPRKEEHVLISEGVIVDNG